MKATSPQSPKGRILTGLKKYKSIYGRDAQKILVNEKMYGQLQTQEIASLPVVLEKKQRQAFLLE